VNVRGIHEFAVDRSVPCPWALPRRARRVLWEEDDVNEVVDKCRMFEAAPW